MREGASERANEIAIECMTVIKKMICLLVLGYHKWLHFYWNISIYARDRLQAAVMVLYI